jgi:hypothetical protein
MKLNKICLLGLLFISTYVLGNDNDGWSLNKQSATDDVNAFTISSDEGGVSNPNPNPNSPPRGSDETIDAPIDKEIMVLLFLGLGLGLYKTNKIK